MRSLRSLGLAFGEAEGKADRHKAPVRTRNDLSQEAGPVMETLHPIFTIGHAMHPVAQFIDPLGAHGVTLVADVHTIPRSRYHPESNRDMLPEALAVAAIAYLRLPGIT